PLEADHHGLGYDGTPELTSTASTHASASPSRQRLSTYALSTDCDNANGRQGATVAIWISPTERELDILWRQVSGDQSVREVRLCFALNRLATVACFGALALAVTACSTFSHTARPDALQVGGPATGSDAALQ